MTDQTDDDLSPEERAREEARMRVVDESMTRALGRRMYDLDGNVVPFLNPRNPSRQANDYDPFSW